MSLLLKDAYLTISSPSTGIYTEKGSKFLSFAFHVETREEAQTLVSARRKEYYDARHVCYAYMLGPGREEFRSVDDGEPSGTAGRPILGQINSNNLTDILVIVVRYFGGTKLGVSGLIRAYKTAAAAAIDSANIKERTIDDVVTLTFAYPLLNQVMKVVKEVEPAIVRQDFQMECLMVLRIRKGGTSALLGKLEKIREVKVTVSN